MHGHQGHAVVAVGLAVQVGIQGHIVEKARQGRVIGVVFQESADAGGQLLHVLQPAPTLHVILFLQHLHIAGHLADPAVKFHQLQLVAQRPQLHNQLPEILHPPGGGLQLRVIPGGADDLKQRLPLRRRNSLGLFQGRPADLPGGHIDDPSQAQVVRRVADHTQICQHILHLCPVEELHTAHDLIGHAVALEGIFQGVGLGVHPVQNGVVPPVGAPVVAGHDVSHHKVGLVALVEAGLDGHRVPGAVLGPQSLALAPLIVADHRVGRVQDVLGRPVILLQTDGPCVLIALLKAEDIGDIRAPEAVNALVVIAHHADVAVRARQQTRQEELQVVGVLVLINEYVAELILIVRAHLFVALQQGHRMQDDVVKVQGVGLPELLVVKPIYFTDPDFPPISPLLPQLAELLRGEHVPLGVGDHRQQLSSGKLLFLQTQVLENILDDSLGVVGVIDGKIAVIAQFVNIPAQNANAGRVESGCPHIQGLLPQHPLQALLQLPGGLVGEGNGQHLPWPGRLHGTQILHHGPHLLLGVLDILLQKRHLVLGDRNGDLLRVAAPAIAQQVCHPVNEHRGLAGARTRQQQQRPLSGQHALPLHGIEPLVVQLNGLAPGGYKSSF